MTLRLPALGVVLAVLFVFAATAGARDLASGQPGTINTIAGGGLGDGGPPLDAGIQPIGAVGRDARGVLYAGDRSFDQCRTRRVAGGRISTITDACAAAISLDGSVYLYGDGCTVDRWRSGHRVRVAGNGTCAADSGDGGPALAASFEYVRSVAVASDGSLYIASLSRVRKVANGTVTPIAGTGVCCGEDGDGGPATAAKIQTGPLAVDDKGNLYLGSGCHIRRISAGIIDTYAGTGEYDYQERACKFSGDGGAPIAAGIDAQALALNPHGDLYIAGNCRIRKVEGGIITTLAGTGERRPPVDNFGAPCQGGEDGPALSTAVATTPASAWMREGIWSSASGAACACCAPVPCGR